MAGTEAVLGTSFHSLVGGEGMKREHVGSGIQEAPFLPTHFSSYRPVGSRQGEGMKYCKPQHFPFFQPASVNQGKGHLPFRCWLLVNASSSQARRGAGLRWVKRGKGRKGMGGQEGGGLYA